MNDDKKGYSANLMTYIHGLSQYWQDIARNLVWESIKC